VARPLMMMTEANTARVGREQTADIMVVIGNPPYNVGQVNNNDNNKNRVYPVLDGRVRDTYAKDSRASSKNKLADAYVKFFRWATDRLQGHNGIVCLVTNNSFVDQIAFDGMRKHLLEDFTTIYHLDLHGNVRHNPKISGTSHNVFGIQVGVGVTIAIRRSSSTTRGLYYYRVPEDWRRERKLWLLAHAGSAESVEWRQLTPDRQHTWLTEGLRPEFAQFLSTGDSESKSSSGDDAETIFKLYSLGANTNRDAWVYGFDDEQLAQRIRGFIETYNAELSRWIRAGSPKDIDSFVLADETKIKWSSRLKEHFARRVEARYVPSHLRTGLYRPFTREYTYFDPILTHRQGLLPFIFPTPASETENTVICVSAIGHRAPFMTLATYLIPNLTLDSTDGNQCFPYFVYDTDGSNRRENITDWALERFRKAYGLEVTEIARRKPQGFNAGGEAGFWWL
jgi:predicted helicase